MNSTQTNINQLLQSAANAVRERRFKQAIQSLETVVSTHPTQLQARWLLVQAYEGLQQFNLAAEQIDLMLSNLHGDLQAIDQMAAHVLQRGYPLRAVLNAFTGYIAQNPGSANALFNYAYHLGKDGQFENAVKNYLQALKLGISQPEEVHLNIANIYMDHLLNNTKAQTHLTTALELNPRYANAWFNLGNLAEQRGHRDEAKAAFTKCLQLDPANQTALARLADAHKFKSAGEPLFKQLITTSKRANNSDIQFALAKAYEALGDHSSAWQHYTKANQLDAQQFPPYYRQSTEKQFEEIASQFSAQWLARYKGQSHETVFICGMFRTGSTLLEQVLAAHPNFYPGGESEFFPRLVAKHFRQYPQGVANVRPAQMLDWKKQQRAQSGQVKAGNRRLTDKRPDNFLYLGLIKAILPSAKFVVTQRDWRDVATSVFCTRLGPQQNYATNLSDIRHYLGLQQGLIDHWGSLFGDDLLRINYEQLVTQPETAITQLLNGLGEDWNERCLTFNQLENTVKTASVWQVREPLNTHSIGRWKHYLGHFEETFGEQISQQSQA